MKKTIKKNSKEVFCKKCIHCVQSIDKCQNELFKKEKKTWYQKIFVFGHCSEINKNNNCKEFEPKEE